MTDFGSKTIRDEVLLIARILLAILFLTSGWAKLTGYSGTVAYMAQIGVPLPPIATVVAIVIELLGSIALDTWHLDTAVGGVLALLPLQPRSWRHHFWTMEGAERYANSINFYKNLSIIGGFLLLYVRAQANTQSTQGWG